MVFLASMTSESDVAASFPAPPPMPGEKNRLEPSTELLSVLGSWQRGGLGDVVAVVIGGL
jgi:hypothetical protein